MDIPVTLIWSLHNVWMQQIITCTPQNMYIYYVSMRKKEFGKRNDKWFSREKESQTLFPTKGVEGLSMGSELIFHIEPSKAKGTGIGETKQKDSRIKLKPKKEQLDHSNSQPPSSSQVAGWLLSLQILKRTEMEFFLGKRIEEQSA